uniref:Thioesterase domain-containing protein n=1 Tax=Panagrolaimus davidi TaxID=227884 RepID=A0A914QX77_9BILA
MFKRFSSSYVQAVQRFLIGPPEWEETFMKYTSKCKVIDAKPNQRIKYEYIVTKDTLNAAGKLHEGCIASIFDVCMGNLIAPADDIPLQQAAVTVDLSISYMNAVKLGETIIIEANTLKHGKKLAFLEAKVFRKSDNSIVAIGKQTMAIIPKKN